MVLVRVVGNNEKLSRDAAVMHLLCQFLRPKPYGKISTSKLPSALDCIKMRIFLCCFDAVLTVASQIYDLDIIT